MCGIAGYSAFGNYDVRLYIALTNMGLHMQNRGRKSWGWTDGTLVVKALGELEGSWNFSFANNYPKAALHTRYPTTGSLVKENSHPFEIGNIIGMHNGCVNNHDQLQKRYERKCQVDSEHIFHHINEGRSLSDIEAYGAIAFWKDGNIHIGKFNGGDLFLARTPIAWLFASTENAVRQSLRFSGLQKNSIIMKLKEGTLYRLVGDRLEVADVLDFGSYSKSYATWQSGGAISQAETAYMNQYGDYRRNSPNFTGRNTTSHQSTKPAVEDSVSEKKTLGTLETIEKMVNCTVKKRSLVEKILEGKDVASDVQQPAPEPDVTETRKLSHDEEASPKNWYCGFCNKELFDADEYALTVDYDLICEKCAIKNSDKVKSSVALSLLPYDIIKLANLVNPNDIEGESMVCDSCSNIILLEDTLAITANRDFLCMECFSNGEGEDDSYFAPAQLSAEYLTDDIDDIIDEEIEARDALKRRNTTVHENQHQRITLFDDNSIEVVDKMTGEVKVYPNKGYIDNLAMRRKVSW